MSFQIAIDPNRRAATRFIGKVRRGLIKLLADNPEITRTQIADSIGVHRSVVTRQLNGEADMSVGRIAEIAWATGYRPVLSFEKLVRSDGSNLVPHPAPAYSQLSVQSTNMSGNDVVQVEDATADPSSAKNVKITASAL